MTKLKIQSTKIDYVQRYRFLRVILVNRHRWKKKALRSIEGQGNEFLDSHEASTAFASFLKG